MDKLTIATVLIFLSLCSFAQENSFKKQLEVSLGLSDLGGFMDYNNVKGVYNASFNYKFSKYFSSGAQFGYGQLQLYNYLTDENIVGGHIYRYAATGNFHLTPLIISHDNPKMDLFIKGKIGGNTTINQDPNSNSGTKNRIDYGCYFGVKYNPIKSLGVYVELGYGNISYSQFGISHTF